jgi:hypothetical protein
MHEVVRELQAVREHCRLSLHILAAFWGQSGRVGVEIVNVSIGKFLSGLERPNAKNGLLVNKKIMG